jgi:hypothetical protein
MLFIFRLLIFSFFIFAVSGILFADNIRQPVKTNNSVSDDKYKQLEILINQIHKERETYYKVKNEWDKEINRLSNEISMVKKELINLDEKIKKDKNTIERNEKQLIALKNNVNDSQYFAALYLPILDETINQLENRIINGIPFKLNNRLDRLNSVRKLISDSQKSIVKKFVKVWDYVVSEIEYSMTNEVYTDVIELNNGSKVVNILRIGNYGMYYKTNDMNEYGILMYDNEKYYWKTNLTTNEINGIEAAFNIVNRVRASSIINLPIFNYGHN